MAAESSLSLRDARVRAAFEAVGTLSKDSPALEGAPVMLRTLGLVQGLLLLAKDGDSKPIAEAVVTWLRGPPGLVPASTDGVSGLIEELIKGEGHTWIGAGEAEAIQFLTVLKHLRRVS